MAETQGKRARILSLVFTDLANSTALKSQRGDEAVDQLIARHRACVARLAQECGGRIIDWAGDGCFLTFETSSSAVLFALRLQQTHADEPELPGVRIGIHLGEVTETTNDVGTPRIAGLAVDLASRISGLARPGQVLMSAAVYDSARQRIGVESLGKPILWQAHGTYAVKGFDKEIDIGEAGVEGIAPLSTPTSGDKAKLVRRAKNASAQSRPALPASSGQLRFVPMALGGVLILAIVGVLAYMAGQSRPTATTQPPSATVTEVDAPITSLAVLPFKNISGDPQQEYFVDGMTEALISELAKIRSIKVISRTSAMHYKDTTQTLPEIARELGVDGLVEGSAMKADNEVRITAQLIRAATDEHLWAESYTETLENVLKVQATVALTITTEIKAVVTPDERSRVNAAKTVNLAAYELYMQARHQWNLRSAEGFRLARELFTKSLEIDANFALGHVGLADTYYSQAEYYLMTPTEAYRLGREETEKALDLDPSVGEANATLAMIDFAQNWDWKTAESAFLKSIELVPNYATGHMWYGGYLAAAGLHSRAADEHRLAYELDPASPIVAARYAQSLARNGQIKQSVDLAERVATQYPGNRRILSTLAMVYMAAGRYDSALAAAENMRDAEGSDVIADMTKAVALSHLGRSEESRRLVEDAVSRTDTTTIPAFYVARAYAALNEPDRALEWLTKACDAHEPLALRSRQYPEFDALEGDPLYRALLRRMNFPE